MTELVELIDPKWLTVRLDVAEWLDQPPHPKLIARGMHGFIAELAEQRVIVREALSPGDELWAWREIIGKGPSGAWGYALVRDQSIVRAWVVAAIM